MFHVSLWSVAICSGVNHLYLFIYVITSIVTCIWERERERKMSEWTLEWRWKVKEKEQKGMCHVFSFPNKWFWMIIT